MAERWQLYDEQGRPLDGQSAEASDVYAKALLHSAAHVWVWRQKGDSLDVLLQKRADTVRNYPGRYDISAAGHVDAGETPLTAALRETREEIGYGAAAQELRFVGVTRRYQPGSRDTLTENEFSWLYLLELGDDVSFILEDGEVTSVSWKSLKDIRHDLANSHKRDTYVPHGTTYYNLVFEAIEQARAA